MILYHRYTTVSMLILRMATGTADLYFHASYRSVVRGFHVYKTIWTPVVNEVHPTLQEHGNPEDRYAVSVMKDYDIVGHVPRELSKLVGISLQEMVRYPAK